MPDKEYQIWIPEFESVMSITKPFKNNMNCFANIMGMVIKKVSVQKPNTQGGFEIKLQVDSMSGVTIYPLGLSPNTKHYSKG